MDEVKCDLLKLPNLYVLYHIIIDCDKTIKAFVKAILSRVSKYIFIKKIFSSSFYT